jgi:hypothetical protein|tara:strand:- start:424 stop:630 length:207 start_codon:yes stop_codon:yes gene_type:complete
MFTYKIQKKVLENGIKLILTGEKENIKHEFITEISDKELQKINYKKFVDNFVLALEKKIDLILINDIY